MRKTLLLLSALLIFSVCGAEYKISNIKLTLAGKAHQEAFNELKKHLELTGNKLAPAGGAWKYSCWFCRVRVPVEVPGAVSPPE